MIDDGQDVADELAAASARTRDRRPIRGLTGFTAVEKMAEAIQEARAIAPHITFLPAERPQFAVNAEKDQAPRWQWLDPERFEWHPIKSDGVIRLLSRQALSLVPGREA